MRCPTNKMKSTNPAKFFFVNLESKSSCSRRCHRRSYCRRCHRRSYCRRCHRRRCRRLRYCRRCYCRFTHMIWI
ncbi:hypothetical protein F8M41_002815 [Gigaspora margarita]|uniref:Uncharacterized protein n=1 Tax=Gigaspora margarita TaxID=4874 RepID=A0A8H4AYC1_GIGMA|nr:hypothetical protein F8M41_002815 [Gigaspora margarita]